MPEKVLVTGGSGYLGSHCVKLLLDSTDYDVRASVRGDDPCKTEAVRALAGGDLDKLGRLEVVEADLTKPDSWPAAVQGCTYVVHVASPRPTAVSRGPESEVIGAAVEGVTAVMEACRQVGGGTLRRVVLTSSFTAIDTGEKNKVFDEECWVDPARHPDPADRYRRGKALAERAAWNIAAKVQAEDEHKFDLAVINPGFVVGPALTKQSGTSASIMKLLLNKEICFVPKTSVVMVDVRDVAAAHLAAMTVPEAGGRRHLLGSRAVALGEVARIAHDEFGKYGFQVPTCECPDWFVKIIGFFCADMKSLVPYLDREVKFDNARMTKVLGIQPRGIEDSLVDMGHSLIELGIVEKKPADADGKGQGSTTTKSFTENVENIVKFHKFH